MMQEFRKLLWLITILALVGCGYGVIQWFNENMNPRYIATKCERRIEETIDPAALQSWATNLLANHPDGSNYENGALRAFPGLKKIWKKGGPSGVSIQGGGREEDRFVFITWGDAGGHWGLSVGPTSFVPYIPQHGSRMWKPGVYFWRNFH